MTMRITVAGMLIAVGIVIPMFMPLKLLLEPASFTLASHVAIFVAMFISPGTALAVSLGTTAGFLLGGFPLAIVLRAFTHFVFAFCGAVYIKKNPRILNHAVGSRVFSLVTGVIHGACEFAAISVLYSANEMGEAYYQAGFMNSVLLLVGLGTVVHSMVDFEISVMLRKFLLKEKTIGAMFQKG